MNIEPSISLRRTFFQVLFINNFYLIQKSLFLNKITLNFKYHNFIFHDSLCRKTFKPKYIFMKLKLILRSMFLVFIAIAMSTCATNPVTGKKDFVYSSSLERSNSSCGGESDDHGGEEVCL